MTVRDQEKRRAMALVIGDLPPSAGRAAQRMADALRGEELVHTAFLIRALAVFPEAEGELDERALGEVVSAPSDYDVLLRFLELPEVLGRFPPGIRA